MPLTPSVSMFQNALGGMLTPSPGSSTIGAGNFFSGALGTNFLTNPQLQQSATLYGTPLQGGATSGGLLREQHDFEREQFRNANAQRAQVLDLIGLTGGGGLLNQPLFRSILGNPVGQVAGDISSGVAGSGILGQPGFRDAPGGGSFSGSVGGGGGGSLFDSIMRGRQQSRASILGDIGSLGASQRARINEDAEILGNNMQARLAARGQGGSNLASIAAPAAVEKTRNRALGELEDQLLSRRLATQQSLDEGIFGTAENELGRDIQRRGQGLDFVSGLLGPALGAIKVI